MVDWRMVKAEGWDSKNGSKWKTMPEVMFHYRAAAFWVRIFAPDCALGMQTAEEIIDVGKAQVVTRVDSLDDLADVIASTEDKSIAEIPNEGNQRGMTEEELEEMKNGN